MHKMKHAWRRRWRDGNATTDRCAEAHCLTQGCPKSFVKPSKALLASAGAVDYQFFLILNLCELPQRSEGFPRTALRLYLGRLCLEIILGGTKMISIPFFT